MSAYVTNADLARSVVQSITTARDDLKTLHGRLRDPERQDDCEWCDGHLSDALSELGSIAREHGLIEADESLPNKPLLSPLNVRGGNPVAWANLSARSAA